MRITFVLNRAWTKMSRALKIGVRKIGTQEELMNSWKPTALTFTWPTQHGSGNVCVCVSELWVEIVTCCYSKNSSCSTLEGFTHTCGEKSLCWNVHTRTPAVTVWQVSGREHRVFSFRGNKGLYVDTHFAFMISPVLFAIVVVLGWWGWKSSGILLLVWWETRGRVVRRQWWKLHKALDTHTLPINCLDFIFNHLLH